MGAPLSIVTFKKLVLIYGIYSELGPGAQISINRNDPDQLVFDKQKKIDHKLLVEPGGRARKMDRSINNCISVRFFWEFFDHETNLITWDSITEVKDVTFDFDKGDHQIFMFSCFDGHILNLSP